MMNKKILILFYCLILMGVKLNAQTNALYAWGSNYGGQLGDGTNNDNNSPTRIGTATNWKSISAGYEHTVAINSSGELYAWGDNSSGQLGDGTATARLTPTRIGTATNWTSVAAGVFHNVALNSS